MALLYCCEKLEAIEYFVGWGTLLGLNRERQLLEYDDDIDLYVSINLREKILKVFEGSKLFIDTNYYLNQTPYYLRGQYKHAENKGQSLVDFYFYYESDNWPYVEDRWNMHPCNCMDPSKWIRIPKDMLFPVDIMSFKGGKVKLPRDPTGMCEYFYGSNWSVPVKKGSEYETRICDNQPRVVKISAGRKAWRLMMRIARVARSMALEVMRAFDSKHTR